MNRKIILLILLLLGCKSIEGMEEEQFLEYIKVFSDPSTYLSSLPGDVTNAYILPLLLCCVRFDRCDTL